MRDSRFRRSAEERGDLIDRRPIRFLPRDHRLEHQRVADLARAPHGAFLFEALNDRLHGRVRGALGLRKRVAHFADGGFAEAPEEVEDLELEAGEVGRSTIHVVESTTSVVDCQGWGKSCWVTRLLGCWAPSNLATQQPSNPATDSLPAMKRRM